MSRKLQTPSRFFDALINVKVHAIIIIEKSELDRLNNTYLFDKNAKLFIKQYVYISI